MREDVITIEADVTIVEAMKKMFDKMVTSLVVERAEDSSIYGIITRKDIVNKIVAERVDPNDVKVSEVMSEPLLTISPDMDVVNAARLMAKTDIRRFPVMEKNKLIGLVSNSDIFKATAKSLG